MTKPINHISNLNPQKKIQAFLKSKRFREARIFLFFVFISFGFWILQTLQQEFEITTPIKINYKDLPDGYILTGNSTEKLLVTVQDKGAVLLNYIFSNKFAPIELNLSEGKKEGVIGFGKSELESIVSKQLITTTNLIKIAPDTITVRYDKLGQKKVPIHFDGQIIPAAGYLLENSVQIIPSTIEVYAPNNLLDTLSAVFTEKINIENQTKKIKKTVHLQFPPEVSSKTTTVELSGNVEEAVEKRLDVPVVCSGVPKTLKLKLFPSKVQVICRLPISRFKSLSASDFKVEVLYNDLMNNKNGWVIAKITKKPDFVNFAHLSTSRVDFILETSR